MRFFSLVLSILFCHGASSDNGPEKLEARVYRTPFGEQLNYRLYEPESQGKKLPLVVFLHGAGERGSDNKKQTVHGVPELVAYSRKTDDPVILIAPQVPADMQWVNVLLKRNAHRMPEYPSYPLRLTMQLVDELISSGKVDKSRVYITGISMGGFGTWDYIQRKPDLFAAAMPICGGGDSGQAKWIKNIPLWVHHGDQDRIIIPQRSRDMIAAIKRAGGTPRYSEYEGVGHASWVNAYRNEEVLRWFFAQRKKLP